MIAVVRIATKYLKLHQQDIDTDLVGSHLLWVVGSMVLKIHGYDDTTIKNSAGGTASPSSNTFTIKYHISLNICQKIWSLQYPPSMLHTLRKFMPRPFMWCSLSLEYSCAWHSLLTDTPPNCDMQLWSSPFSFQNLACKVSVGESNWVDRKIQPKYHSFGLINLIH